MKILRRYLRWLLVAVLAMIDLPRATADHILLAGQLLDYAQVKEKLAGKSDVAEKLESCCRVRAPSPERDRAQHYSPEDAWYVYVEIDSLELARRNTFQTCKGFLGAIRECSEEEIRAAQQTAAGPYPNLRYGKYKNFFKTFDSTGEIPRPQQNYLLWFDGADDQKDKAVVGPFIRKPDRLEIHFHSKASFGATIVR